MSEFVKRYPFWLGLHKSKKRIAKLGRFPSAEAAREYHKECVLVFTEADAIRWIEKGAKEER